MFVFTISPDDAEQFEVPASTRDILVWEKSGKDRSVAGLLADMKVTDLYAIAHIASRRTQLFTGTLAEFEASCDMVTDALRPDGEQEQGPDPTRPAPSAEPSSPSPSPPGSSRRSGQTKKSR